MLSLLLHYRFSSQFHLFFHCAFKPFFWSSPTGPIRSCFQFNSSMVLLINSQVDLQVDRRAALGLKAFRLINWSTSKSTDLSIPSSGPAKKYNAPLFHLTSQLTMQMAGQPKTWCSSGAVINRCRSTRTSSYHDSLWSSTPSASAIVTRQQVN